jgi:hypothetical protein
VGAEEAVEALHCEAAADGGNGDGGGRVVFLHMGVDGGATEFKLECRAMNEVRQADLPRFQPTTKLFTPTHAHTCHKADFRCPDERQHQPRQTPILAQHEEGLEHAYYSHLDLASLVSQSMGVSFSGRA